MTTAELAQRRSALRAADETRLARAKLKRKLRAQQTTLAQSLSEPCIQTAEVLDMLEAQWNWGKATALSCLARLEGEGVRIKSNTHIGALSERQLEALREALRSGEVVARRSA